MAPATPSRTHGPGRKVTRHWHASLGPVAWLVVTLMGLGALLALLPAGTAEVLQTVLIWLLLGLVASLVVILVAMGLEHLLDCESS